MYIWSQLWWGREKKITGCLLASYQSWWTLGSVIKLSKINKWIKKQIKKNHWGRHLVSTSVLHMHSYLPVYAHTYIQIHAHNSLLHTNDFVSKIFCISQGSVVKQNYWNECSSSMELLGCVLWPNARWSYNGHMQVERFRKPEASKSKKVEALE